MRRYAVLLSAAALAVVGNQADATTVYDSPLASPPGVFFGSGNPNSNFTVTDVGNVELGQSAIIRFVGPVDPGVGSNVYNVPTGATSVPTKTGAAWGVDFSINVANGGGTANLSGFTALWTLTDVGNGTTGSFNPLLIPDNALFGSPATAAQNSEALSFASIAAAFGDPGFDLNANDTYDFTLELFDVTGAPVAENSIVVVAGTGAPVPEPSSIALFGAGLLALGGLGIFKPVARGRAGKFSAWS